MESPAERNRLTKALKDHLIKMQLMEVTIFDETVFEYNLLQTIENCNFDIVVFHVVGPIDQRNVLEAYQAGKKIITLNRVSPDNDLLEIYHNLRKAGIPSCLKLGNASEMTRKITDLLAQQFSEPARTVPAGV